MESLDVFRIAFRVRTLFFPADIYELAITLAQRGYKLEAILGPRRPTPVGLTGGVVNPLASKGDLIIDVNTDRGLVGVTGPNAPAVMDVMAEIVEIFRDNYRVKKTDYMFFEFSGQIRRNTEKNPITTMNQLTQGVTYVDKLNKVFNIDTAVRSIRIGAKGVSLESEKYFDLTIEPLLGASEQTMVVSVVRRDPDLDTLKKQVANVTVEMEQAIKAIQG